MSKILRVLFYGLVLAIILTGCTVKNSNEKATAVNNVTAAKQDQTHDGSKVNESQASNVTTGNMIKFDQANIFDKNTVKVGDNNESGDGSLTHKIRNDESPAKFSGLFALYV